MATNEDSETLTEEERIRAVVRDELNEQDTEATGGRRDFLQALGLGGLAAGVGGGTGYAARSAIEPASAQSTSDSVGDVGTPSDPVDVFAAGISADEISSLVTNNVRWVDASSETDSDLNTALSNYSDVTLYGGTLTLTSTSIVLPANTTLHFLNANIKVDGAVGHADGTLNTQSNNDNNRTFDMMIDARGNNAAELNVLAGTTVLDANIGGSTDRAHAMFSDAADVRMSGPIETRGGRAIWIWDVDDSHFEGGRHFHADDANNQGSAVLNIEGARNSAFEDIKAVGDPSATTNISEAVDINAYCRDCRVEDVRAIGTAENVLDISMSPNTQATGVYGENLQSGEGGVQIRADADWGGPQLSSRSESTCNGVTVRDVTVEQPSGSTYPAVRVYERGDMEFKSMSITGVTARDCPAFEYGEGSTSVNNLWSGFRFEGSSVGSGGDAFTFNSSQVSDGCTVDVTAYQPSGRGVDTDALTSSTITATVRGAGSDGVRYAGSQSRLMVTAVSSSGDGLVIPASNNACHVTVNYNTYGIDETNGDNNKFDGSAQSNSSGATTSIASSSKTDLVV